MASIISSPIGGVSGDGVSEEQLATKFDKLFLTISADATATLGSGHKLLGNHTLTLPPGTAAGQIIRVTKAIGSVPIIAGSLLTSAGVTATLEFDTDDSELLFRWNGSEWEI